MTVEVTPLPTAETGNRPPKTVAKERKQQEAQARKEILAPVRPALTAASIIIAISSVCNVVPFILIVEACRELLDDPVDTDRVWWLLGGAVVVLVVRGLLQAVALTWSHLVDAGYQLTVRRALAEKLTRVPLGWFGERTSAEVKKYLQDDVEALHYLVAHARLEFVGALVMPLVTLGYLFTVDWRMTLVLLLPLVFYAVTLAMMMDQNSRDRLAVYNRWEQRTREATIEFADGIQVVRAFGQAGKAHSVYQEAVDSQAGSFDRWKTPIIRLQAVSDVVIAPVFVMLVIVAAGLGAVGLGGWSRSISCRSCWSASDSAARCSDSATADRRCARRARRCCDCTTYSRPRTARGRGATQDPATAGTVRFESVEFGYRDDHSVLRDVSFELTPGTLTALVGPSGSGKSTLAKLLPRFYDVNAGRITIGGRDIREFTTEELYRTVGFVFQDVRLIRGTIRDNLRLAREDADDAALEQAARAAQIHDRIMALPRGYDSEIGGDASLSGGEAQRLSIARALLADSPVLVLDEATAFADPESEAAVQDALAVLVAGRTVLVIAHRLHTITGVDRILVLEGEPWWNRVTTRVCARRAAPISDCGRSTRRR